MGGGGFDAGTIQNQGAVGTAPLPEGQVCGGADLLDGRFGIKFGLVRLPGKLQNQAVLVVVCIELIVGDIQGNQTILDDRLGRVELLVGGIKAVRREERHIDAALDIHAEADI